MLTELAQTIAADPGLAYAAGMAVWTALVATLAR